MTVKRFWMLATFAGVPVFIGGLIATIVLTAETGERLPDSECGSAMRAAVLAVCYASSDPKVLLGVAPLLLGAAMVGVGIWRSFAAASNEVDTGGRGGGLFGSLKALQQQAMDSMQASSTLSVGGTPPAPPSESPPESPSPSDR